jgi:hypothetical protein
LDENLVDFIDVYKDSVNLFGDQYRALSASARSEMTLMEKNHNARVMSRIGFVSQDMKDFEYEIFNAIQERATEINNNNAECLLEAQRSLSELSVEAGEVVMNATRIVIDDLDLLYDDVFYPIMNVIETLVSQYEKEILTILGSFNAVTSMRTILLTLESEIRNYGALFEYFVSYIYVDMVIFELLTNLTVQNIFPQLSAGLDTFRTAGNGIRDSLANCN